MNIEPSQFQCEQHGNLDYLTPAVKRAITGGSVVVYRQADEPYALLGRRNNGDFKVVVECPGKDDADDAHKLTFTGTWSQ
jgi:hypothetical protein